MLLFFRHQCRGPEAANDLVATATAWCDQEGVLAVATSDGAVHFYLDEVSSLQQQYVFAFHSLNHSLARLVRYQGQRAASSTPIQGSVNGISAVRLAFHPTDKTLAAGWSDGQISVWNPLSDISSSSLENRSCCLSANSDVHSTVIVFMLWNPTGSRLISGDAAGVACIWKASRMGELTPISQYRKGGGAALTAATFCTAANPGVATKKFFFGTESGAVCLADDKGHCLDVQKMSSSIDSLLFFESAMRLVIITRSLLMVQLRIGADDRVMQYMRIKLSVSASATAAEGGLKQVVWAGPGLLAAATGESLLRLWDLSKDESYVLSLKDAGAASGDRAVSLAFSPSKRYLSAGTKSGSVLTWRFAGEYCSESAMAPVSAPPSKVAIASGADDWEPQQALSLGKGRVPNLNWAGTDGLLAVTMDGGGVCILQETVLHCQLSSGVAVMQLSGNTLQVEYETPHDRDRGGRLQPSSPSAPVTVNTDINIRGMHLNGDALLIVSGKEGQVLTLRGVGGVDPDVRRPFPTAATCGIVDAAREQVFLAVGSRIEIVNLDGGHKSSIPFTDGEGCPTLLDVNGNFMAVVTDKGAIKLFDLSRRERGGVDGLQVKPLGSSGKFISAEDGSSLGHVRSVRCNASGTCVSLLSDRLIGGEAMSIREPDSRLHIYDADKDVVLHYDFGGSCRYPSAHFWDTNDARLLACETRRVRKLGPSLPRESHAGEAQSASSPTQQEKWGGDEALAAAARQSAKARSAAMAEPAETVSAEVTTFFISAEHGIQMQDSLQLAPPLESLLGLAVPRLYFMASSDEAEPDGSRGCTLVSRLLRDFVGLTDVDASSTQALLDFSFHLTAGDMDRAYAAVRLMRAHSVWENMAHMCIKTKRLDVAEVCLGNMGHARGAAALRRAKLEPEKDVCVAAVAIQLGRLDEAAALFRGCGRFDLLNDLYRAAGLWDRALSVADSEDRIHLQSTHHLYAQHLERVGDAAGAIRHYESAGTHKTEVPRMLFDKGRLGDLEDYASTTDDPSLFKWWAQYNESIGHKAKAQDFYTKAGDHLNLVRLACYEEDLERAAQLAEQSGSPAAAYHLARHLESLGDVQAAVRLYAKSQCYNHAIRLAKVYGMDAELMSFALQAAPSLKVDVGGYFEAKGEVDKAAQLYSKAGDTSRALELCLSPSSSASASFEVLFSMVEALQAQGGGSPELIERCSQFLVSNGQVRQAAKLLATSGQWHMATELCLEHQVKLDEELVELLTPPSKDSCSPDVRQQALVQIARACKRQGQWHLACKMYTQAGDRLRAMKCLLKSGDTKNISYYAGVSRDKDIYILAANYLQSLNWHDDASIMRSIVTFYSKAKAYSLLGRFYEACADVELDEYRDYGKAVAALRQALKYAEKAKEGALDPGAADALRSIQQRLAIVESFHTAEKAEPLKAIQIVQELVNTPGVEQAINIGTAYSFLVGCMASIGDWAGSHQTVQQMLGRGLRLKTYVDEDLLRKIYAGVGDEFVPEQDPASGNRARDDEIDDEDSVPEEVSD
jgi:intraflagellar transport protein 140